MSLLEVFLIEIFSLKIILGESLVKCLFEENTTSDF